MDELARPIPEDKHAPNAATTVPSIPPVAEQDEHRHEADDDTKRPPTNDCASPSESEVGSTLPPIATLQTVDAVDFRTCRVTSAVVGASSTIPRRMSMYSGYGAGGVSAPKSPSAAAAAARAITRSPSPSSVEPQSLNTVAADRIPNFVSNHIRMFLDDRLFVENLDLLTRTFNDEVDATGAEWLVPKLEPSAVESFAAVVMADVSGYSKLTAYLAEKGDSATEYLARTMKGYLDKIVQIIIDYKGDIVKFAGDAVVVYWKSDLDPEELESRAKCSCNREKGVACGCVRCIKGDVVLQASKCCLELLSQLGRFPVDIPDCEITELKIHLGIGAGSVYDVHVVGDVSRSEHFIAGNGVNQLAQVLDLAKPGQLALSHAAYQHLKHVVDSSMLDINNYDKRCIILAGLERALENQKKTSILTTVKKSTEQSKMKLYAGIMIPSTVRAQLYQRYINPSALYKLHSSFDTSMSLNDLRRVTSIFLKIGSLKFADVSELHDAQAAARIVQSMMQKYEGILRQFNVDDKGAVLFACFGLPPLSHENDSVYGVKAALEIAREFSESFNQFSIGVTTGVISISGIGYKTRTEYALLGDAINMAARLMCLDAAQNGVLCDEKTYKACQSVINFEDLGTAKVKGKAYPIAIYRPLSIKNRGDNQQPSCDGKTMLAGPLDDKKKKSTVLIGRKKEMALIEKVLTDYASGKAATLIMEGTTGSGISSMGNFVLERAEAKHINTCVGQANEMTKSAAYASFQDIVLDIMTLVVSLPATQPRFPHPGDDVAKSSARRLVMSGTVPNIKPSPSYKSMLGSLMNLSRSTSTVNSGTVSVVRLAEENDAKGSVKYAVDNEATRSGDSSKPVRTVRGSFSALFGSSHKLDTSANDSRKSPKVTRIQLGATELCAPPQLVTNNVQPRQMMISDVPGELPSSANRLSKVSISDPARPKSGVQPSGLRIMNVPALDKSMNSGETKNGAKHDILGGSAQLELKNQTQNDLQINFVDTAANTHVLQQSGGLNATDLQELIHTCLERVGEDPKLVRLFALIYPLDFDVDEEEAWNKAPQFLELLKRIFTYVTTRVSLLVMLEESQWLDPQAFKLTEELFNSCPNLLLVISMRVEKQGSDILRLFTNTNGTSRVTRFALEGIKQQDMPDLIMHFWCQLVVKVNVQQHAMEAADPTPPTTTVKKVQDELVTFIYQRSNGSPQLANSLMQTLVERDALEVIGSEQVLALKTVINGKLVDVNELVPQSDLQGAIVAQFDRLELTFQQFLKVASVIGEHFLLADVLLFLPNAPKFKFDAAKIQQLDKYDFLRYRADGDAVMVNFKNSLVRSTIYAMMYNEQKQQIHEQLGQHYQSILNDSNRGRMILPIYEHFNLAGNRACALLYNEKLARFYRDTNALDESAKSYLNLIDKHMDQPNAKRGIWFLELGQVYNRQHEHTRAIDCSLKALDLLGYQFPRSPLKFKIRFAVEWLKRLYKFNYGAFVTANSSKESLEKLLAQRECFFTLACSMQENMSDYRMYQLAVMLALNLSEKVSKDVHYSRLQSMFALFASGKPWLTPLALKALEDAEATALTSDVTDIQNAAIVSLNIGHVFFLSGQFELALRKYNSVRQFADATIDFKLWIDTVLYITLINTIENRYQKTTNLTVSGRHVCKRSSEEKDTRGELVGAMVTVSEMLFQEDMSKRDMQVLSQALQLMKSGNDLQVTKGIAERLCVDSVYLLGKYYDLMLRRDAGSNDKSENLGFVFEMLDARASVLQRLNTSHWVSIYGLIHYAYLLVAILETLDEPEGFRHFVEDDMMGDTLDVAEVEVLTTASQKVTRFCLDASHVLIKQFPMCSITRPLVMVYRCLEKMFGDLPALEINALREGAAAWWKQPANALNVEKYPILGLLVQSMTPQKQDAATRSSALIFQMRSKSAKALIS